MTKPFHAMTKPFHAILNAVTRFWRETTAEAATRIQFIIQLTDEWSHHDEDR